jgi:hypothetical protein
MGPAAPRRPAGAEGVREPGPACSRRRSIPQALALSTNPDALALSSDALTRTPPAASIETVKNDHDLVQDMHRAQESLATGSRQHLDIGRIPRRWADPRALSCADDCRGTRTLGSPGGASGCPEAGVLQRQIASVAAEADLAHGMDQMIHSPAEANRRQARSAGTARLMGP